MKISLLHYLFSRLKNSFSLCNFKRITFMNTSIYGLIQVFVLLFLNSNPQVAYSQKVPNNINSLLKNIPLLSQDRGKRELLYQYSIGDFSGLSKIEAEWIIKELEKRGIGVITHWKRGASIESHIEESLRIAQIQEKLGFKVVVDATKLLYGFYDDNPNLAHINKEGIKYFDNSFAGHIMGCPFSLHERIPIIRSRVIAYVEAYKAAGINIDIITADWEIDGPHEWNEAWTNSKLCVRCQEKIPAIQDFIAFQAAMRSLRSKLINRSYTSTILQHYPNALIANYATYPNDGWRYWYDYFENFQKELPHCTDQKALYRPWYDEFTETGFTMAMPVVYTWYPIFNSYPDYSPDYRWFYNMLKVGSNAGKSTPAGIPIATFVHWHTIAPHDNPDKNVKQMSPNYYKELLWHLLLRGHDLFYSWCWEDEIVTEMSFLQEVYDNSLKYNNWIISGRPVFFDVPTQEKSVISAVKLNNKVLVRRTDFTDFTEDISLEIDNVQIIVPFKPGECQIIYLEKQ